MTRKSTSAVGNRGMPHLNGDVLCVLDTETTGLTAGHHDMIEIVVIPLDAQLEPMKGVPHFERLVRPKRPQNVDPTAMAVNKIKLEDLEIHGMDAWRAADQFDDWFQSLELVPGKRIVPMAKNWQFDAGFIGDWLGTETFRSIFHYRARELTAVLHWFNDRADFQSEKAPFPSVKLEDVAGRLGYKFTAHRAYDDALMTARIYKHLMTRPLK